MFFLCFLFWTSSHFLTLQKSTSLILVVFLPVVKRFGTSNSQALRLDDDWRALRCRDSSLLSRFGLFEAFSRLTLRFFRLHGGGGTVGNGTTITQTYVAAAGKVAGLRSKKRFVFIKVYSSPSAVNPVMPGRFRLLACGRKVGGYGGLAGMVDVVDVAVGRGKLAM